MSESLISSKETQSLLSQSKVMIHKGQQVLVYEINLNNQPSFRLDLAFADDLTSDIKFLLQIRRSCKNTIQLTLHLQENARKCCLIRIDFNQGSQHTNPPYIEGTIVPKELKKYAGATFRGSHIHINVDGYKEAAWALPLEESDFPVKNFDESDFANSFDEIINAFSSKINLVTDIRHEKVIPL